jgi:outer membrane protein TolC
LQAERQEKQLRGQRAFSTILLAKAIGGGWDNLFVPRRANSQ